MSKLAGYFKGSFTDRETGRVVDYAKVYIADAITKGGAGLQVVAYKAAVDALKDLTPACINRDVTVYFDKYNRVQLVKFEDAVAAK